MCERRYAHRLEISAVVLTLDAKRGRMLCCHGTPFCVEDASVCVCVCVCVVGKGIPFFFLSQSFEVKTLPCVSAVRELLCGQSVRPFLCRWKARLFSLLTWKASVCVWETRKYAQELDESNHERSVSVCVRVLWASVSRSFSCCSRWK